MFEEQQRSILDEAEGQAEIAYDRGPYPGYVDQKSLEELKHSIRLHALMMNGPSQTLCAYLIKLIDILEDSDVERRNKELNILSYSIVEGMALFVQSSVDQRIEKAKASGIAVQDSVRISSDAIIIAIGQSRGLADKIQAKSNVLKVVSDALKALSVLTKAVYPEITDVNGKPY